MGTSPPRAPPPIDIFLENPDSDLIGQASALFGGGAPDQVQEALLGRLEETRAIINKVNMAFQDPALTTFVCVCIPEFLSIYETERLVQELSKFGIDSHNIVVNQVLFPE